MWIHQQSFAGMALRIINLNWRSKTIQENKKSQYNAVSGSVLIDWSLSFRPLNVSFVKVTDLFGSADWKPWLRSVQKTENLCTACLGLQVQSLGTKQNLKWLRMQSDIHFDQCIDPHNELYNLCQVKLHNRRTTLWITKWRHSDRNLETQCQK